MSHWTPPPTVTAPPLPSRRCALVAFELVNCEFWIVMRMPLPFKDSAPPCQPPSHDSKSVSEIAPEHTPLNSTGSGLQSSPPTAYCLPFQLESYEIEIAPPFPYDAAL